MKKSLVLISAILVIVLSLGVFVACGPKDDTPDTPDPLTFVKADGIRVLDPDGNPMGLMGTNLGGWLVQEQWLCPTETGQEIAQLDIYLTLYNRFGEEKAEELIDVFEDNWVTEQDFASIKAIGLNCVRIPFSYKGVAENILRFYPVLEVVRQLPIVSIFNNNVF